jgi:hypothetical protein
MTWRRIEEGRNKQAITQNAAILLQRLRRFAPDIDN